MKTHFLNPAQDDSIRSRNHTKEKCTDASILLTRWPATATTSLSSLRKCGSVASWSVEMLTISDGTEGSDRPTAFSANTLLEVRLDKPKTLGCATTLLRSSGICVNHKIIKLLAI